MAKIVSNIFGDLPIKRGEKEDLVQNNISNEPDPYFKKYWEPEITLKDGITTIVKHMVKSNQNDY